jgi:hypothetical protein
MMGGLVMQLGEEEFKKWTKYGLVFRGVRAGHNLFQAAIFHVLEF